jgi:hypothetical protein
LARVAFPFSASISAARWISASTMPAATKSRLEQDLDASLAANTNPGGN